MMTLIAAIVGMIVLFAGVALVGWVLWPKIGGWFKDSETLYLAVATMIGGLGTTLTGAIQAADWSPLLKTPFTTRDLLATGGAIFMQGLVTYLARKNRATDL